MVVKVHKNADVIKEEVLSISNKIKEIELQLSTFKPLLKKKQRELQDCVFPDLKTLATEYGFILIPKGMAKGRVRKPTSKKEDKKNSFDDSFEEFRASF